MIKRELVLLLLVLFLILPLTSAELKIEKKAVVDSVVPEIDKPAVYNFNIKNLGATDNFLIYSLVGVEMKPNETFTISQGETKELTVEMWPEEAILKSPGTFNFVYKIRGEKSGIQDDVVLIKIVKLKDAIEINSYNINLESDKAIVYAKNRIGLSFSEIKARIHSAFFDFSKTFSLDGYAKEEFEINLNKEEIKKLVAGQYRTTSEIETYGVKETFESFFMFTEKAEITTQETKSGLLISKLTIKKINEGNLPTVVQVKVRKNIISRLFTNFNADPATAEREGFFVYYVFQKEIKPSEIFTVKATTNWFYPLILLAAIVIIALLIRAYTSTLVILKKKATYVKTKGGEFALKINLNLKARKFVEKLTVIDKIPSLVKVHERFGAVEPDKIDEKNRRLEWNVESLQQNEERVFSYIIYSKVAPIGKFELPTATAVYEQEGKIHEVNSNKVFFISEMLRKQSF